MSESKASPLQGDRGRGGRLVHSHLVKSYESLVTLKTDNWASGTYTYSITLEGEILKTDAFEIIK